MHTFDARQKAAHWSPPKSPRQSGMAQPTHSWDLRGVPAKPDGEELEEEKLPPVAMPSLETGESGATSGTLPDIRTPPGGGRSTECEHEGEEPVSSSPDGPGNVELNLSMGGFTQTERKESGSGKHDPADPSLTMGAFTYNETLDSGTDFGLENFLPAFSGVSFAFAGGKCTITAKLDIDCPWGVKANGRTDVPSGTDAVVTKANFAKIVSDLTPGAAIPHRSPRTQYWSKSLTQRHEKFHATEDNKWATNTGKGLAETKIKAGTVNTGATANAQVTALLEEARKHLIAENKKWYKGAGAEPQGEIDAYADGKAEYEALAKAVDTHGKTLP